MRRSGESGAEPGEAHAHQQGHIGSRGPSRASRTLRPRRSLPEIRKIEQSGLSRGTRSQEANHAIGSQELATEPKGADARSEGVSGTSVDRVVGKEAAEARRAREIEVALGNSRTRSQTMKCAEGQNTDTLKGEAIWRDSQRIRVGEYNADTRNAVEGAEEGREKQAEAVSGEAQPESRLNRERK